MKLVPMGTIRGNTVTIYTLGRVNYHDQTTSRWIAYFSAVEELDPTLAVGLDRPRLDVKICAASVTVYSEQQSVKELSEINQISAKHINVWMAHCFFS